MMIIKPMQLPLLLLPGLISVLIAAAPAQAKDIAIEQYKMTALQKEYGGAQSDYDTTTQLLKEQEKRVAQDQARLQDLRQKQAAAKAHLDKTKAELDREQKSLDQAWSENNK
jgi:hypothetical protein